MRFKQGAVKSTKHSRQQCRGKLCVYRTQGHSWKVRRLSEEALLVLTSFLLLQPAPLCLLTSLLPSPHPFLWGRFTFLSKPNALLGATSPVTFLTSLQENSTSRDFYCRSLPDTEAGAHSSPASTCKLQMQNRTALQLTFWQRLTQNKSINHIELICQYLH